MISQNEISNEMKVKKRNGELEDVSFDKILHRVKKLAKEADIKLNFAELVMKIIDQLYDGIDTTKIDELTAEQCASQITDHINYSTLASRVIISNHQKNTGKTFFETMNLLYNFTDVNGDNKPMISEQFYNNCKTLQVEIENIIDYTRDYKIDYFGFKTLEKSYLYRVDNIIVERIQHLWMRVAVSIHGNNIDNIKTTYDLLSNKYFTHATPT